MTEASQKVQVFGVGRYVPLIGPETSHFLHFLKDVQMLSEEFRQPKFTHAHVGIKIVNILSIVYRNGFINSR